MATMEHSVREGKGCLPRHMLKRVGSHCIVECRCRRGGVYARGKILGMEEKEDSVRCMLIDDFRQVNVHISQVFYTNNDVLRFPKFVSWNIFFFNLIILGTDKQCIIVSIYVYFSHWSVNWKIWIAFWDILTWKTCSVNLWRASGNLACATAPSKYSILAGRFPWFNW